MDRRLIVLALGMFALGTDSFVVARVLSEIFHFYNVPIGAAGQMTTIYAVTYALLAPTIAALAAGVPCKTLLLSGLALFISPIWQRQPRQLSRVHLRRACSPGWMPQCSLPRSPGAAAMIVAPERRGFALCTYLGVSAAGVIGATEYRRHRLSGASSWRFA